MSHHLERVAARPTSLSAGTQVVSERIVLTLDPENHPRCPNVKAGCAFVDLVLAESPGGVELTTPSHSRTELMFRTETLRVVGGT